LQRLSIDPSRDRVSMEGDRHRRVDVDSFCNCFRARREIPEFLEHTLEVVDGCRRLSVTDRVDPQDAVLFRKPHHDVFLLSGSLSQSLLKQTMS
jgi:hypothetical protein